MTTARPAASAWPILSASPVLIRWWAKVPANAPVAAEPISGVDQNRTALGVLADQHRTLQRNAFVLGGIDEGLKIVTSRIEVLIAGDEHQRVVFTHHETPDMCVTAGNRPRLTMLAT